MAATCYNKTGQPHACMTCRNKATCKAQPTDKNASVECCTGYLGPHQEIRQVISYG